MHADKLEAKFRAELSMAVRRESDPHAFVRTAQEMLGRHLGANRVCFAEFDLATLLTTVRQEWTDGVPSMVGVHRQRDYGELRLAEVLAGKAFVLCDAEHDFPAGPHLERIRAVGAMASIAIPAVVDKQLIALAIVHQSKPRQWTDAEVALVRDVADIVAVELRRARTLCALSQSERQLRELADAMPQMVFAARQDGVVYYSNKRWFEYTGLDPRYLGPPDFSVVHPDDSLRVKAKWAEALRSESEYELECRIRRASDGQYRWHLSRVLPTRDESGTVIRWYASMTDIHDRKVAEERLAFTIESSEMGTWQIDLDTLEVIASDRLKRNWGQPIDEPYDFRKALKTIHPEDRAYVKKAYELALETGSYAVEYRVNWPDGSTHWVAVHGRITRGPDGKPKAFTGVTQLIDERKAAEQQREALLLDEQRASRLKDEFVATLSHELRTPLNAILGWSEVSRTLIEPSMPIDLVTAIDTISRNARAMNKIVEDSLDMSRILTGRLRLDVDVVDVHAVIRSAALAARPAQDAKGIALELALDLNSQSLVGDPYRLQQIMWNLLSNAVKFAPVNGRIELSVGRRGPSIEIRITDNGEGIPGAFLPFVFERFRQADGSITRRHGGLGIGLAVVKELVELHGGTVKAESAGPGCGATFVVTLPITPLHPVAAVPQPSVPATLSGIGVVLFDDEETETLRDVLANEGAKVRCASSADEAIALMRDEPPDVLLSDLDEDFMRRVRGLPEQSGGAVPAAALTGAGILEALDAGFQMRLAKPVEREQLVATVRTLARAAR